MLQNRSSELRGIRVQGEGNQHGEKSETCDPNNRNHPSVHQAAEARFPVSLKVKASFYLRLWEGIGVLQT
jgi:hypothetical protein